MNGCSSPRACSTSFPPSHSLLSSHKVSLAKVFFFSQSSLWDLFVGSIDFIGSEWSHQALPLCSQSAGSQAIVEPFGYQTIHILCKRLCSWTRLLSFIEIRSWSSFRRHPIASTKKFHQHYQSSHYRTSSSSKWTHFLVALVAELQISRQKIAESSGELRSKAWETKSTFEPKRSFKLWSVFIQFEQARSFLLNGQVSHCDHRLSGILLVRSICLQLVSSFLVLFSAYKRNNYFSDFSPILVFWLRLQLLVFPALAHRH